MPAWHISFSLSDSPYLSLSLARHAPSQAAAAKAQRKPYRAQVRGERRKRAWQAVAAEQRELLPALPPGFRCVYEPRKSQRVGWAATHHQVVIRKRGGPSRSIIMNFPADSVGEPAEFIAAYSSAVHSALEWATSVN